MAVLEFTPSEGRLLASALHAYEQTLLLEIAHADTRAFKEMLRANEAGVHTLLERVQAGCLEPVGNT